MKTGFCTLITFGLLLVSLPGLHAEPWKRHTIDGSSRGADGVRLADVNGDGLQDMVTGWEEGGVVRLYLNPGPKRSQRPWPGGLVESYHQPADGPA